MSTRPEPSSQRQALADERGAIMVLGIFMCATVVGAMWYVAGIGDALIFRERIQETVDAGAFSGAALHARGMNLIVLINLVMACILGIRVALKTAQLTLIILAAIFAALSFFFPALAGLASLCADGAGELQSIISELKNPIDQALKALSKAEVGIARAVPAAACVGGTMVANRFGPPVSSSVFVGISVDTVTKGLPLQEGTADRLCYEAGRSVGALTGYLLGKIGIDGLKGGKGADYFGSIMGKIAQKGGAFFCEMGSGGGAPNFDDIFEDNANEKCKADRAKLQKEFDDANGAWLSKCAALGATCRDRDEWGLEVSEQTGTEKLKPEQQTELNTLHTTRDAKKADLDAFNGDKCKNDAMKTMRDGAKKMNSSSSSSGNGNDMTPKMVIPDWQNGNNNTQVMSWGNGDTAYMRYGTKGAAVGQQKANKADLSLPLVTAGLGMSQAEYFYDCEGAWKSGKCNGGTDVKDNEEAMWHFRWRARLRRYNRPYTDLGTPIEIPMIAAKDEWALRGAKSGVFTLTSPQNIQLKAQLLRFKNLGDARDVVLH